MDDEAGDRDENAGVRDVEGRPRMRERHMEIEERKIDDVTVPETIGEIAHDAGEEQGERNVAQDIGRTSSQQ